MTSTSWTLTLDDNLPLPVVDLTPAHGPGAQDVTVDEWPFGPGPMPPAPKSYAAVLERWDGPVVVERVSGRAWSSSIAVVTDEGRRFRFRFVPDLVVDL
jgi:hypothetical protein